MASRGTSPPFPNDTPMATVQISGPNTTATSKLEDLRQGAYVRSVVPIVTTAGILTPRGRYYAQIQIFRQKGLMCETVWTGYITTGQTPTSIINRTTRDRDTIQMQVWAGTKGVAAQFAVMVCFGYGDDKGAFLFTEFPGGPIGSGDVFSIDFTAPAAGADFPAQTVGANVRQVLRAFRGSLVTAAAVANRQFKMRYKDPSTAVAYDSNTAKAQAASLTFNYEAALESPTIDESALPTADIAMFLPILWLPTNWVWAPTTISLQAADQWGSGVAQIEEWVYPQP